MLTLHNIGLATMSNHYN